MEPENSSKYQKLAAEYSKLRAKASVLRQAVIDEQNKSSALRESLKEREANLRKSVQEVDSLGFRNKQLERKVASLQQDLEELKKVNTKGQKSKNVSINDSITCPADAHVIKEDLAKKIMENSQLMMQIDDRNAEIKQCQVRMDGLNRELQQQAAVEQKLRKEMEALALRNTELEAKISEAASTIGSEDGLSVTADMENHYNSNSNHFSSTSSQAAGSGANGNGHHNNHGASAGGGGNCDDRIVFLEKELSHWRAQYELLKIESTSQWGTSVVEEARHISSKKELEFPHEGAEKNSEDNQIQSEQQLREKKLTDCFTKSIGNLFHDKCRAESKLASHLLESQRLQSHLDIMKNRLKEGEETIRHKEHRYHIIEDELARTRLNYEEQISVLTEQVVSLSEQLASCK